ELVEDHAVQLVDLRPWQLAAAQALHRRLIAAAPLLGECLPIEGDAALAAEGCQLAQDAAMPVDHGAEHVEDQRLDAAPHILCHSIPSGGWNAGREDPHLTLPLCVHKVGVARVSVSSSSAHR